MAKNLCTVVGLVATALFFAQAPEAAAQTTPVKSAVAVKSSSTPKPKKKARKLRAAAKPTASAPAAAVAATTPQAPSDAEKLVMAAREQAYTDVKIAMANGGSVREINGAQMPYTRSVLDNLRLSLDHTIFYQCIQHAGLLEKLGGQSFTLFAPSNSALQQDPALLKQLQDGQNRSLFDRFIVADQILLARSEPGQPIKMTTGETVDLQQKDSVFMLTDQNGKLVTVAAADIACSNGFLNLIDGTINSKSGSIRKQK